MQKTYRQFRLKSFRIKNGRAIILSKCAICNNKISTFIKKQEAKGLLSNLGYKTPLSNILFLFDNSIY